MILMKINSLLSLTVSLLLILSSSNTFSQTTTNNVDNPVEYFNKRTRALRLAKGEHWKELIPIGESLTRQYQMDGDLFYILGLSYYETEQYQKAITAFTRTLELGGTIQVIPTGSRPSNDIMIKIAKAYALDGDKASAMVWLKKGFAYRYDEKPFLKGDPAFQAFNQDEDFLQLFGIKNQVDMTREESWTNDLDYLQRRIVEMHYDLDDVITKEELNALLKN